MILLYIIIDTHNHMCFIIQCRIYVCVCASVCFRACVFVCVCVPLPLYLAVVDFNSVRCVSRPLV